jgi:Asp-tRNA(Asn)/Glu-tRNA(Gln) amidotransferase B subunit
MLPYDIISPEHMAQIVMMVEDETISRKTAREVQEVFIFKGMLKRGLIKED